MELGEKIKQARKNKNLTQTELAKIIGVRSAAVISLWESGQTAPTSMTTIKNLCDTLDLTLCDLFNTIPKTCTVISSDEKEIISKMQFLDGEAKDRILKVVNTEYKRCITPYTSDPVLFQITINYPIFLTKDDFDYTNIQKNIKELKEKKKAKNITSHSITKYLWMIGYNGHISIAQVCAIFLGLLVPSQQLYNCINAYITDSYKVAPAGYVSKIEQKEPTNTFHLYIERTLSNIENRITNILQIQNHSVPFRIHAYVDQLDNIWITLSAISPESIDSKILPPSNAVKIAFIRLACSNEEICIDRLAVHPILQRIGIGSSLIDYIKGLAQANNISNIIVHPSYNVAIPSAYSSANFLKTIFGDKNSKFENAPKEFYKKNNFEILDDDPRTLIYTGLL